MPPTFRILPPGADRSAPARFPGALPALLVVLITLVALTAA
jgi:hypothetical protein